jgi:hypothetical protein
LPIFGEKFGVFLNTQCYDQNYAKTSSNLREKNAIFFAKFFGENIFKIITSVPRLISFAYQVCVVLQQRALRSVGQADEGVEALRNPRHALDHKPKTVRKLTKLGGFKDGRIYFVP